MPMWLKVLVRPYEAMKETADSRRWPVAVWIIGAAGAPVLMVFAVIAKFMGGLAETGWLYPLLVPAALVIVTYVAAALVIAGVCRLVRGNGDPVRHLSAWALSYPPTVFVFIVNIAGHFLPVKMIEAPWWLQVAWFGILAFGLLWKLLLYFIYLRVVGELGFRQMVVASAILFAVVVAYEAAMLALGLAKVPFI